MIRPVLAKAADVSRPARVRWQAWRHEQFLREVLGDQDACLRIAHGGPLPPGYGRGLSERAIEYPWVLGQRLHGELLDAGGTFNHAIVLAATPPQVKHVHVVTLAPERELPDPRISYCWTDLRQLPIDDASFDVIVCLSTLEHVGMDNTGYGADERPAAHPEAECIKVLRELRRVIKPGGTLLLSVPYGAATTMPTMRQITKEELNVWREVFEPTTQRLDVFAYTASGWTVSSPEAAATARYRERARELVARDRATAARAVACMALEA